MPKEEWGTKRLCPQCGTRFYDLQHDPMTCPACSAEFTAEALLTARGRAMIAEKTPARDAAEDEVIETDDDLDAREADGDLDDDLLENDDDADVSLDEIADVADDEDEA